MLKSILITRAKIILLLSLLCLINLSYAHDYHSCDYVPGPYVKGDVFQYRPHHFHHYCNYRVLHHYPEYRANHHSPNGHYRMTVIVYPGSLRDNVKRIAKIYGWRNVVWDTPNDFKFVGSVHIRANSIVGVMAKLLQNYPLQAVFYRGNRVIVIKPRALA